ncbi:hypothetical protein DSO57_1011104 [Entomophthora muscae]|uniref:Uncharacterized protein n=1 Tax=Entomophthora muscae TaxID=34485 RepID=A0ACC2T6K5_9FUNG|nr:hypothetical protein DSO57_1011104 [Entomophthora muscae]
MRFYTLSACLLFSGVFSASISQGDGLMNSYIRNGENISPTTKGYLQNFVNTLNPNEIPFNQEDYTQIFAKLRNSQSLKNLLLDHVVDFDLDGLSIPPEESQKALITLSDQLKKAVTSRIKTAIHYRMSEPNPQAATERIRPILDRLAAVDDLEDKLYMQASTRLDSTPNLPETINLLIQWLPDVFENDVLSYLTFFFNEADTYKPEVAITLRKVFHRVQKEYDIFPQTYYEKLVEVTPIPTSYEG